MIRSLSGSELSDAQELLSSMQDNDILGNARMLSRDWLRNTQAFVAPVDAFFPGHPSEDISARRLLEAINDCPVSELLVTLMYPLNESGKRYNNGSKLLDSGAVDPDTSGIFIMSNDSDSVHAIFGDGLFTFGMLITDCNGSFALLHDMPAEHYVVAGPRAYVEQSLGMSVDKGWKEYDESVDSYITPREKKFFKNVGEYYRDAGKTC
jgi:hypothetical protein